MTTRQHARILTQYFYNLTLDSLGEILEANDTVIYAQMNLGFSSQLEADRRMLETVEKALNKASQEDLLRLEKLIKELLAV